VLDHGFARIRCDACAHEYLLAFSCKCRYFCPSCHAKRLAIWTQWLDTTLLAPVPHRPVGDRTIYSGDPDLISYPVDIVSSANTNERVVVWAHNEHVWKREGNGGYDVLGRQLARWYGPTYYAIGFDFGSGAYRAPGADSWVHDVGPPQPTSFTVRATAGGQIPMRNGVRIFDQSITLGDRFDGLLFVSKSTPTTMLKR
jgi:hypothetical protein